MAAPPIVFIHGAWVTPASWDGWTRYFEARGYQCLAPAWPGKDRPIAEIRADPSPLRGLGIGEIADHYERIVRAQPAPPILIGHSIGGLIVEILLNRGLGAAGVAIDPAPPRGVWAFEPTAIRSLLAVLLTPLGWRRVVRWSPEQFQYAFVHTSSAAEARAIYEAHVTPESGRVFFQGALSLASPRSPTRVDFRNASRAPLLLIAGELDHIVPAVVNRRNFRAYRQSAARTDFREFVGRTHWIVSQPGWEEVAGFAATWVEDVLDGPGRTAQEPEPRRTAPARSPGQFESPGRRREGASG